MRLGINAEQIWVTLFRLYANLVAQSLIIEIRMCLCQVRAGLAISLLSRVVENTQLEFNILEISRGDSFNRFSRSLSSVLYISPLFEEISLLASLEGCSVH